jgi:hypothetical protein
MMGRIAGSLTPPWRSMIEYFAMDDQSAGEVLPLPRAGDGEVAT